MLRHALAAVGGTLAKTWPWLLLALAVLVAVWHDVDFPEDIDPEFPSIERPTFSRRPPPAYRLAEPGDTIDRVALYLASMATVFSVWGLVRSRPKDRRSDRGLWISAFCLSLIALWHSATPGPTFDGWHGLGWRTILEPSAPATLRLGLVAAGSILLVGTVLPILAPRQRWRILWEQGGTAGVRGLLLVSLVLCGLRQFELPGVEPVGYWPRFALVFGLLSWCLVLARLLPRPGGWKRAIAVGLVAVASWYALVRFGLEVTWYHRPLARMRTIESGRIYISAMPTYRGLKVAQARHHFKTIVNLFPEDTPLRSPILPDELRFAREHGINYVASPSDPAASDAFLERTLQLANDPSAWPILVHCHGCQDRTPAWVGIYRFVYKGTPLAEIMRDIERQRGYCPKGSVILLYNRVLEELAPDRFENDPTASILVRAAGKTHDPYYDQQRNGRLKRELEARRAPLRIGRKENSGGRDATVRP